jgi:hypothetical protein
MGRKITDGNAVDVVVPDATLVEKGELYRIDKWSGFAMDQIDATEVDRAVALEVSTSLWRVKVPAGTCGTRGNYVTWSAGGTFKAGATDLVDEAARTLISVAKVEGVRNSRGYATLKLVV